MKTVISLFINVKNMVPKFLNINFLVKILAFDDTESWSRVTKIVEVRNIFSIIVTVLRLCIVKEWYHTEMIVQNVVPSDDMVCY